MNKFQCSNSPVACYPNSCQSGVCDDNSVYYQPSPHPQQTLPFPIDPLMHPMAVSGTAMMPYTVNDPYGMQPQPHCNTVTPLIESIAVMPEPNTNNLHQFTHLPFVMAAHPQAHLPNANEIDIPIPEYAPCQGPRPWNFSYCYGFYGEPACPMVNLVDMEDFM